MGALRQSVNKGVDRCVSLTTSTSTWQWRACVPSRGGGFKVQSKSYNVLCAREEWSGTYISVPGRGRGGVLFLLQAGRLPNQEQKGRRLGAASRMLEVTDCGTAVHHARTCIKLPQPRAQQQQHSHHHHHHHHYNHHQPCEQRLGRQDRPAGRAACKWAYSHYFPEQPPTSQQPGARLMTR